MRLTFNIQKYAQHSGLLMSPGIVVEEDSSLSSRHPTAAPPDTCSIVLSWHLDECVQHCSASTGDLPIRASRCGVARYLCNCDLMNV